MSKFLLVLGGDLPPVKVESREEITNYLEQSNVNTSRVEIYRFEQELTPQVKWVVGSSVPAQDVARQEINRILSIPPANAIDIPLVALERESTSTPSTKTRRNKRWTESETLTAIAMKREGIDSGAIAKKLGRTRTAVNKRINEFGGTQNGSTWTDEETTKALNLENAGYSDQAIGIKLNRTAGAVRNRLYKVKREGF